MKVLIVHAHHEPNSFCSALSQHAKAELEKNGHTVIFSDLYALKFDPVSDRRNFTTTKDSNYLKQQQEEMNATANNGFAPDLESEIQKLEQCDAVLFSFPLWWFGMPAILKGWCDRVLAMGRVYGGAKLYENGIGQSKKRAMIIMTTGGGPGAYDGWGMNPAMQNLLQPIQHGVFWFNGILPLEPFIAWSPARISAEEREQFLSQLTVRINSLLEEQPIKLPPLADFPNFGSDSKSRYQVVISRKSPVDEKYKSLIPAESQVMKELKREGLLLDFDMSDSDDPEWRAFLKMRASDDGELKKQLDRLPLAPYLHFDITKIKPVPAL